MEEWTMTTAIVGTGNIGKSVARHLVNGGERVIITSRDKSHADALADELGGLASSATVGQAIASADNIVLTVWLDPMKELLAKYRDQLNGKVVIDPSNPVSLDKDGKMSRTLPEGTSSGQVVSSLLPPGAHYVKAFGTLGADSLASGANRKPDKVVLFYATDDDKAARTAESLITLAGFDPVKAGGVKDSIRVEVFGDLAQYGGLNGKLLTRREAEALLMAEAPKLK
jgi:8-hydroxy-5-deazaflavin:NADPH oxidoreductase